MSFEWLKILCQVGIAVKEVFGICGKHTAFCFSYQQFVSFQKIKEAVSSYVDVMLMKERLKHDKKFTATTAGLLFTDRINLLQHELFIH